ncbi:unnamed protein product [Leptosia nina]|uniref:Lipase domain-containing protein n=1 Tax=Leptosia nina TaxID=320188 RepID=A0AAV1J8L9_9NEOP
MKVLIVLLVSACSSFGSTTPSIPGDNSHYVKGVSRYIWMPDGNGVPHLVDLKAEGHPVDPKTGAKNEYRLFTRFNQYNYQVLEFNNTNSVRNSNYNPNKPITVIVHGFNSDGDASVNQMVRNALMHVDFYNVIVLDWSKSLSILYPVSVEAVPSTGEYLGKFLEWLIDNFGGDWSKVHLIGHSLGAHVVGNAGRAVGGRVARITGLDPAGPEFGGSSHALNTADAQYVECIHTDGGLLGIYDPICTSNFYPNGGRNPQPGCLLSTCSHSRSYEFLSATIRYNRFIGIRCADVDELKNNLCNGGELHMGNTQFSKEGYV